MTTFGVVVADGDDVLSAHLTDRLAAADVDVRRVSVGAVGSTTITVDAAGAELDGRTLDLALVRARPGSHWAQGFRREDAAFGDHEVRATWLAVLDHPDVVVLNRPDERSWYAPSDWPTWSARLAAAAIPTVPLDLGVDVPEGDAAWQPWGGGVTRPPPAGVARRMASAIVRTPARRRLLWCAGWFVDDAGRVVGQGRGGVLAELGDVLASSGVRLAAVGLADGRVAWCTTDLDVLPVQADVVSARLMEDLRDDLHRR